jgi:hypothetical protein
MLALGKGEGIVSVFDANGRFLRLRTPQGDPLVIPILWGMAFGNGILNQPTDVLFFAAGPNFGAGGVYGRISATRPEPEALELAGDEG